jgi:hypothetical protein
MILCTNGSYNCELVGDEYRIVEIETGSIRKRVKTDEQARFPTALVAKWGYEFTGADAVEAVKTIYQKHGFEY